MKTHSISYADRTREISSVLAALRRSQPTLMQTFSQLAQDATGPGVLSAKTKELMALALGVAGHCDGCIGLHIQALVRLGATRAEVEETLAVAIYMGGEPALMYAASALAALEQFQHLAAEAAA